MYLDRTHYAVIQDGEVVEYPVCPIVIDAVTCESNLPVNWDGGFFEGKQYVFCHNVEPHHSYLQALVETTPRLNQENGLWYRHYEVVDAPQDEFKKRSDERASIMLAQAERELVELQGMQEYISSLSQEQQQAWALFTQTLKTLQQQQGFPWIDYPFRPDVTTLNIQVERV